MLRSLGFSTAPVDRLIIRLEFPCIGRHPKHFWRLDNQKGGIYFRLDDAAEIEKALAAGAKKCRDQKPDGYCQCW